jgi:cytoskeletal protein CcmA (bactofilin family)
MYGKDDKKRRMEDIAGPVTSIVAPNSIFKGTFQGEETILISGRFEGEVKSREMVRIDKTGKVEGPVESPHVIIEGELIGDIRSAEHVELRSESRITGNVMTKKIAVAEGCLFKGEIQMPSKTDHPISFVEKRNKKEDSEIPGLEKK